MAGPILSLAQRIVALSKKAIAHRRSILGKDNSLKKELLFSLPICFCIFLLGLSAKETDIEQKQTNVDKTKIVEEWQTNPESFIKLFLGDNLSKRSPTKEATFLRDKSIMDKVIGSHVEWPVTFGIWPGWFALPEKENREFGLDNLGLFYLIGPDVSGWMDVNDSYRQEGTKKITWKQMTWGIPPQSSVIVKTKIESVSAIILKNGTFMFNVKGNELEIKTSAKKCDWPKYESEIPASPFIANFPAMNSCEVRVTNELGFQVKVGLRSDEKGKDFIVPKIGAASIRVPTGTYQIYFQFAGDPESLYQGDILNVTGSGIGIQLKGEGAGGYKLRKIKQSL